MSTCINCLNLNWDNSCAIKAKENSVLLVCNCPEFIDHYEIEPDFDKEDEEFDKLFDFFPYDYEDFDEYDTIFYLEREDIL